MLGPIGSNLMNILKVLTPSEIDMYSEINEKQGLERPMAVGAEDFNYEDHSSSPNNQYRSKIKKDAEHSKKDQRQDQEDNKAKIIPINEKVKEEIENEQSQKKQNFEEEKKNKNLQIEAQWKEQSSENSALNALGILTKDQQRQVQQERQRQENCKKDSTSVFILNQRENLKKSRLKMVGQKAIAQYQRNSNTEHLIREVDLDDVNEEEEMQNDNSKGILINKKHY